VPVWRWRGRARLADRMAAAIHEDRAGNTSQAIPVGVVDQALP
jgi:hypothetical protein